MGKDAFARFKKGFMINVCGNHVVIFPVVYVLSGDKNQYAEYLSEGGFSDYIEASEIFQSYPTPKEVLQYTLRVREIELVKCENTISALKVSTENWDKEELEKVIGNYTKKADVLKSAIEWNKKKLEEA